MDYRLGLMCGAPLPIPECQITVHQPTIEEISYIGEQDFFSGVQCLCLYKSMFVDDASLLEDTTNFQIFMTIMQDKSTIDKKESVKKVLTLLFPKYRHTFTPKSLLVMPINGGENVIIDEENFENLQNVLRLIFCSQTGPMDQQAFNPGNEAARKIAQKLMKGRQRIAEEKAALNISVFSQYMSILAIGSGLSLLDSKQLTMYQLYDLMERYSLFLNWDIDIKSRLAGGKPDKEADNWMKNIHEK